MIQRLQTLFLILALIANGLMFSFEFWSASAANDSDRVVEQLSLGLTHLSYETTLQDKRAASETHIYLIGLHGLASLLGLGAIFLYTNRTFQLRVSRLAMLLETGLLVLLLFYTDGATKDYFTNSVSNSSYQLGIFLPIVSILCFFMANLFIMRDEQKVRSAERLR
jgi:hypothetical protein